MAVTDEYVKTRLDAIKNDIQKERDWEVRSKALNMIGEVADMCASDSPARLDTFAAHLRTMKRELIDNVLDLRSSIVKDSCDLLSHVAELLGTKFELLFTDLLEPLIKQIVVSIAVIKDSANECLVSCLGVCPTLRILPKILDTTKSKSSLQRLRMAEYLRLIAESWPDEALDRALPRIDPILRSTVLTDPDASVRRVGRHVMKAVHDRKPETALRWLGMSDATTKKYVKEEWGIQAEDLVRPAMLITKPSYQSIQVKVERERAMAWSREKAHNTDHVGTVAVPGEALAQGTTAASPKMASLPPVAERVESSTRPAARDPKIVSRYNPSQPVVSSARGAGSQQANTRIMKSSVDSRHKPLPRKPVSPSPTARRPRANSHSPANRTPLFARNASASAAPATASPRVKKTIMSGGRSGSSPDINSLEKQPTPPPSLGAPETAGGEVAENLIDSPETPKLRKEMFYSETRLTPQSTRRQLSTPASPIPFTGFVPGSARKMEMNLLSADEVERDEGRLELSLLSLRACQRGLYHHTALIAHLTEREHDLNQALERVQQGYDGRNAWFKERFLLPIENELVSTLRRLTAAQQALDAIQMRIEEDRKLAEVEARRLIGQANTIQEELWQEILLSTTAARRTAALTEGVASSPSNALTDPIAELQKALRQLSPAPLVGEAPTQSGHGTSVISGEMEMDLIAELWADARDCKAKHLDPALQSLAKSSRCEARLCPLTSITRAMEQVYESITQLPPPAQQGDAHTRPIHSTHKGFLALCDIASGSLVCADLNGVVAVVRDICKSPEWKVVAYRNGFDETKPNPTSSGKRELVLNVRFNSDRAKHVTEVRIQLKALEEVTRNQGWKTNTYHLATQLHLLDENLHTVWSDVLWRQIFDGTVRNVDLAYVPGVPIHELVEAFRSPHCKLETLSLMGCFQTSDTLARQDTGIDPSGQSDLLDMNDKLYLSEDILTPAMKSSRTASIAPSPLYTPVSGAKSGQAPDAAQKTLRSLNLNLNTDLTDMEMEGIGFLCGPALRTLEMRGCAKIGDIGLITLTRQCNSLTYLDISQCIEVTDACVTKILASCGDTLRHLFLTKTKVKDPTVEAVVQYCKRIETLVIGATKITDKSMDTLAQDPPPLLTSLDISWTRLSENAVVDMIHDCPGIVQGLRELKAYNTRFGDAALVKLPELGTNLQKLDLGNTKVTDQLVTAIGQQCTQLRTLGLNGTTVTDLAVCEIAGACKELEHLNLNYTAVGDEAVKALARGCPRLVEVGLYNTTVTDAGVRELVHACPHLAMLDLYSTDISDEVAAELRTLNPGLTILI